MVVVVVVGSRHLKTWRGPHWDSRQARDLSVTVTKTEPAVKTMVPPDISAAAASHPYMAVTVGTVGTVLPSTCVPSLLVLCLRTESELPWLMLVYLLLHFPAVLQ